MVLFTEGGKEGGDEVMGVDGGVDKVGPVFELVVEDGSGPQQKRELRSGSKLANKGIRRTCATQSEPTTSEVSTVSRFQKDDHRK